MAASIFVLESAVYWPVLVIALKSPLIRAVFSKAKTSIDRFCGALLVYLGVRVAVTE